MKYRKLLQIAGIVLVIISMAFIVHRVATMDVDFSVLLSYQNAILGAVLIVVCTCMIFLGFYAWKSILDFISRKKNSYKVLLPVFLSSNLGKYIPGNVAQYAVRNALGASLGLSQAQIAAGSLCEVCGLCATGVILALLLARESFVGFLWEYFGNNAILRAILIMAVVLICCVAAVLLWKKKDWIRGNLAPFLTKNGLALAGKLFLLYSASLVICSVVFMAILWHSTAVSSHQVLPALSAYIVSWIVGFVVIGAPGGIGVRETVLLLMLQNYFSADIVLFAAVFNRVVNILADVLAWVIGNLFVKTAKHKGCGVSHG